MVVAARWRGETEAKASAKVECLFGEEKSHEAANRFESLAPSELSAFCRCTHLAADRLRSATMKPKTATTTTTTNPQKKLQAIQTPLTGNTN